MTAVRKKCNDFGRFRRVATTLLMALVGVGGFSQDLRCADIDYARQWCDATVLAGPEGIWEFPEDETTVLVSRSSNRKGFYDIFVISTPDCRLHAGDLLGELRNSVDRNKFRLSLFCRRKDNLLTDSRECLATLSDDGYAMHIAGKKYKISLRNIYILPKFWRMVRVSVDNPLDKLPEGMVKVYPSPDGNDSRRGEIRVL